MQNEYRVEGKIDGKWQTYPSIVVTETEQDAIDLVEMLGFTATKYKVTFIGVYLNGRTLKS